LPNLTENLGLKKPLDTETADIAIINENMDKIDAGIKTIKDPNIVDVNGNEVLKFSNMSNAVDYLQIINGSSIAEPGIIAAGESADINIKLAPKGLGKIRVIASNATHFIMATVANAVNYLQVKSAITANAPTIEALGTDANIDVNIKPKGTGKLKVNSSDVALKSDITTHEGAADPHTQYTLDTDFVAHTADNVAHGNKVYTAGGTANAITINTGGAFKFVQGAKLMFRAIATNTGSVTISVDAIGTLLILNVVGESELAAGTIKINKYYELVYDPARNPHFFLLARASGNAVAGDVLAGKTASTDAGEILGNIQIRAGDTGSNATASGTGDIFITVPKGYYDGDDRVFAYDADFISPNIPLGKNMFGLEGTAIIAGNPDKFPVPSGSTTWMQGYRNQPYVASYVEVTAGYMRVNSSALGEQYVVTSQTVNLTGVKYIIASIKEEAGNIPGSNILGVSTTQITNTFVTNTSANISSGSTTMLVLNVNSLNGLHYIQVGAKSLDSGGSRVSYINDVKLVYGN
jgi:hypothetical protein